MLKQSQVHVDHMQKYNFVILTRALITQPIANEESFELPVRKQSVANIETGQVINGFKFYINL